ncbi:Zinc carboxypeptidase [Burkholderiales bacterium JOSHI_001]|nr:Zinc carboxypeptidase [Burkholderiales bacterium JOSHI_001]
MFRMRRSLSPPHDSRVAEHTTHPLLADIDTLIAGAGARLRSRVVAQVSLRRQALPLHLLEMGSNAPDAPVLALFGGVHGLERIGIELLLSFLSSLVGRLRWDVAAQGLLQRVRVVAMPLVNPGGLLRGTRANPAGVDLMRNAPVDCLHGAPTGVGGQRLSASLPWYRGPAGAPMQTEAQALCDTVLAELGPPGQRPLVLCVDCHSGFGALDRLWFPHAHTPQPVAHLPELFALNRLLDSALTHHPYVFEPQSRQYLAHGDLWDHLVLQADAMAAAGGAPVFLPLTLEMGSWLWVKKNPRQVLSRQGLFNPLILHRQQRVLRRHLGLLDFLLRATASHAQWLPAPDLREPLRSAALAHWYQPRPR